MCDIIDQPAPRCRGADLRLSFWQAAGAGRTGTCLVAAEIWEKTVRASLASGLSDGLGLPRPGVARTVGRLANQAGRRGRDKTLALGLRYARIVARHAHEPVPELAPAIQGSPRGVRLLPSELAEVNLSWSSLLRSGACTILADGNGNLRPAALRTVARRLKSVRQGKLFQPRETAEEIILELATAVGRPRKRKRT